MAATNGEDVTTGEVARRLEEIVKTITALTEKMLLREVYEARQALTDVRVKSLEDDRVAAKAEASANRRLLLGGVIAFTSSIAVQVVIVVVTLVFSSKG